MGRRRCLGLRNHTSTQVVADDDTAWTGGKASGTRGADGLMVQAIRTERQLSLAAREAWVRCRETDTPEACAG